MMVALMIIKALNFKMFDVKEFICSPSCLPKIENNSSSYAFQLMIQCFNFIRNLFMRLLFALAVVLFHY
jgi:hypothetical protein